MALLYADIKLLMPNQSTKEILFQKLILFPLPHDVKLMLTQLQRTGNSA